MSGENLTYLRGGFSPLIFNIKNKAPSFGNFDRFQISNLQFFSCIANASSISKDSIRQSASKFLKKSNFGSLKESLLVYL